MIAELVARWRGHAEEAGVKPCVECRRRRDWWATTGNLMLLALAAALWRFFEDPNIRALMLSLIAIETARRFG